MPRASLSERFQDVAFTTAVPFSDDGSDVLYEDLADNLAKQYDAGARLFIPCGNTGEYYSLTDEERTEIVETHVEATGDEAMIAGGVAGSLAEVERLADAYEDAGADAIMVMHPDHTYLHQRGLANYYHRICDATDLGVVIYKRGPEVPRDVIVDLSERENVVAVKFAVNDIKEFSQTVADAPGEVTWVNGIAERYALSFAIEGATGYTTGLGNFAPEATLALFDAVEDENWERARSIQRLLRPIEDLREEPGEDNALSGANNVSVIKRGMDLAGYTGGSLRDPLVDLSADDAARLEEYYETVQSTPLLEAA
ncbi:dihydrodipicolinate synthetase (plasmid) [Haloterrigena turkmenica DSM 5511]|uniref:Dihydrodipicolinate synthetase n=1 Tax=Haloterrigena turkmenica (strain ATCC 51198 / DSM 5511 / JCM 9101 / NCIMB 13204 / VKM B-1734 / 4k) TaxID=543526 RepID=D2S1K0_HALTV|nr:dihydrodipicolinate synthase family protein [Haloterrigena turkmenica]ADB63247.1 dihydrodipicolinate synthetase [Haloterrigena turkmenica DSM 5511]